MSDLKDKVVEFASIAGGLPENLQVGCFELLLKHYLNSITGPKSSPREESANPSPVEPPEHAAAAQTGESQDDLSDADLHMKVKHFLKKHSLSADDLNNIFYKEEDKILPLYDDLKTTTMSESQMRIALLQGLRQAIDTGNFEAQVEEVRSECTDRKCNDKSNFAANFKKNKTLFDFDDYTGSTKAVKLSEEGRTKLAEIIKEIQ